ncbi:MAG: class 1 fructose-bisphosphatase [Bacteroidetes bacterium]|nr:class 1 fructose-bisphosphatase [Bacteroidota bacterium]
MAARLITLNQFIVERQKDFPCSEGRLSRLLADIGAAAKIISREVNKAGLVDILGADGSTNVQGEEVQKLDAYANNTFISFLRNGGECAVIASEEDEDVIITEDAYVHTNPKYVVAMDPLDGSSNIDVNASIGTIFSIYRRRSKQGEASKADVLQKGSEQVASGYVIYGSSTMLVLTTGNGVNGFTLDPSIGEFCLSHPKIRIKPDGKIFSVNEGNYHAFNPGVKKFIEWCKDPAKEEGPLKARYIGSLVADFHRNLLKGGIFMYPSTAETPNGKLRLVYECNPMAFIVEQAGGRATNGTVRIMDIQPTELHQRVPYAVGSENLMDQLHTTLGVWG